MTRSILKTVLCGVILGTLAFFVPKLLLGLFILGFIVTALHCCGHGRRRQRMFYMADRIRSMSEEEYNEFKANMDRGCCNNGYHRHGHCCCGSKAKGKECCKSKKKQPSN